MVKVTDDVTVFVECVCGWVFSWQLFVDSVM